VHLGEVPGVEGGPEPGHAGRRDLEARPQGRMPQARRRAVQDHGQAGRHGRAVQVERGRRGRRRQRRDHRPGDLGAAWRLRARRHHALDLQDGLLRDRRAAAVRAGAVLAGMGLDDLGQAGAVPDDQERHGLELPAAMQPAGDHHVLADVRRQVGG
jgi:hypothetical protein